MAAITSKFDPTMAVDKKILKMTPKELCALCSGVCTRVRKTVGDRGFMGGIYPSNISLSEGGVVSLGSTPGDWTEEEIDFMAPELYWKGEKSPAADVYSVGMLIVYASYGGKLPFEHVFNKENAREHRFNGDKFIVPERMGKRVCEIAQKATQFNPAERFTDVGELKAALDSCISKLTTSGNFSEDVFNKSSVNELSDVEKMMLSIVNERNVALDASPVEEEQEKTAPEEKINEATEEIQDVPAAEDEFLPLEEPIHRDNEEVANEISESLAGIFDTPAKPKNRNLSTKVKRGAYVPDEEETEEEEAEPVVAYNVPKKKQKPVKKQQDGSTKASLIILILCFFLVASAIAFNIISERIKERLAIEQQAIDEKKQTAEQILNDSSQYGENLNNNSEQGENPGTVVEPTPTPTPEPTPEPTPVEHRYELIVKDVTWREAAEECRQLGGYLATISSAEELQEIINICEERGIYRVWIGCHRENGELVWEGPNGGYYQWGRGEPSGYDYNDNVSEDYVLLWKLGDWVYNDSRNDPVGDYPGDYSGKIGYICEYGE